MKCSRLLLKTANVMVLFVAFSMASSCKKDDIGDKVAIKGQAKVKLINASQTSPAVDFYLDDAKINPTALAYGESSDYISIVSGNKTAKVNPGASTSEVYANFNFMPSFSYTSFYVEDREGKGEVLTLEDNLGAVESGKSRIRFVNLSPNFTNALNVNLAGGEFIVNALAFKEYSGYFMVNEGTNVRISVVGTGAFKVALGDEFEGGKNYTIWLSGTSNANLRINKITYN